MRSYESKPTPKRASTGRRTQGNQTGNARATTTMTRHPRPTALNHLFFLEATADMTVERSRSRRKCLFDSFRFAQKGTRITTVIEINAPARSCRRGLSLGEAVENSPRFQPRVWDAETAEPRRGERKRLTKSAISFVPEGICFVCARSPSDESLGYFHLSLIYFQRLTASRCYGQPLLVLLAHHQHALFLVWLEHEVRRGGKDALNGSEFLGNKCRHLTKSFAFYDHEQIVTARH